MDNQLITTNTATTLMVAIPITEYASVKDAVNGLATALVKLPKLSGNSESDRVKIFQLIEEAAKKFQNGTGLAPPGIDFDNLCKGSAIFIGTSYTREQMDWFKLVSPIIIQHPEFNGLTKKRNGPAAVIRWLAGMLMQEMTREDLELKVDEIKQWFKRAMTLDGNKKESDKGIVDTDNVLIHGTLGKWLVDTAVPAVECKRSGGKRGFVRRLIEYGRRRFPDEKSLRMFLEGRGEPPFTVLLDEPNQQIAQEITPELQTPEQSLPQKITVHGKITADKINISDGDLKLLGFVAPAITTIIGHNASIGETIDYFLMEFQKEMQDNEKELKILFRENWEKVSTGKTNVQYNYTLSSDLEKLLQPLRDKLNVFAQKREETVSWTALIRLMVEWMKDQGFDNPKTLKAYLERSQQPE